jgi:predicted RNase H-like HicB family nuclease
VTQQYFVAIIERAEEGFGVFVPDFPGCTSGADTVDEAARGIAEALRGHVELMIQDRDPLPEPTPIEDIPHDPEAREAARVLVSVDLPGKAVRVNVSFDEGLLARIDAVAAGRGVSRSAFLADAARAKLAEHAGARHDAPTDSRRAARRST